MRVMFEYLPSYHSQIVFSVLVDCPESSKYVCVPLGNIGFSLSVFGSYTMDACIRFSSCR